MSKTNLSANSLKQSRAGLMTASTRLVGGKLCLHRVMIIRDNSAFGTRHRLRQPKWPNSRFHFVGSRQSGAPL